MTEQPDRPDVVVSFFQSAIDEFAPSPIRLMRLWVRLAQLGKRPDVRGAQNLLREVGLKGAGVLLVGLLAPLVILAEIQSGVTPTSREEASHTNAPNTAPLPSNNGASRTVTLPQSPPKPSRIDRKRSGELYRQLRNVGPGVSIKRVQEIMGSPGTVRSEVHDNLGKASKSLAWSDGIGGKCIVNFETQFMYYGRKWRPTPRMQVVSWSNSLEYNPAGMPQPERVTHANFLRCGGYRRHLIECRQILGAEYQYRETMREHPNSISRRRASEQKYPDQRMYMAVMSDRFEPGPRHRQTNGTAVWKDDNGGSCTIHFVDDQVVSKSQSGLK